MTRRHHSTVEVSWHCGTQSQLQAKERRTFQKTLVYGKRNETFDEEAS
jgi:hypothetical protein